MGLGVTGWVVGDRSSQIGRVRGGVVGQGYQLWFPVQSSPWE